jgi:hypothetical protein
MLEVVESQQIQPTGEQLSINVLVKLGGIMYVNIVPCIFYNVHTCKFFYYKSVFSQFRMGGSWKFFCKIRWALKFLSTS